MNFPLEPTMILNFLESVYFLEENVFYHFFEFSREDEFFINSCHSFLQLLPKFMNVL